MSRPVYHPRLLTRRLSDALRTAPVVLLHGPRQCGKTTLAQLIGRRRGSAYLTFDDPVALAGARSDPTGFVAGLPERVILDEVQKAPEIFPLIKLQVDRHRVPGRFLLTGSSNVLLVPRLSESLAGRMAILRLHPLAQAELPGGKPGFLDHLFGGGFATRPWPRSGAPSIERLAAGGFPPALAARLPRRRAAWHRDYVETLIQRDARQLRRIDSLDLLPRLLALAAARTAQLANIHDLAGPFQVSRPTIGSYVTVLERIFLLDRLPPWHASRDGRLVKTPKLHLGDTGLATAILGVDAAGLARDRVLFGHLLETFVFQELRRQATGDDPDTLFHHYRDRDNAEVDIVLEREGRLAGVEVKAAATVFPSDFTGLRKLKSKTGRSFVRGVVLYDGDSAVSFGDGLHALPLPALWSAPPPP